MVFPWGFVLFNIVLGPHGPKSGTEGPKTTINNTMYSTLQMKKLMSLMGGPPAATSYFCPAWDFCGRVPS